MPCRPWPERRELRALCRLLPWQAPVPRLTRRQLVLVPRLSAVPPPGRVEAGAAAALERRLQAWRQHTGGSLVLFHDDAYPPPLREIARPPVALFVQGDVGALHGTLLAVVGARAATPAYRQWTRDTAAALAGAGIVIGSGLARGIDAAAHQGALDGRGKTVAVVGAGSDVCYPPENARLQAAIARSGCVVSELLPGTPPRPWHFPSRNRILAGIARGVLVVQAEHKSGALITARFALQENRDVMAVPGDVQDPRSRGPHALLRQGAALVESAGDVLHEFGWHAAADADADTPQAAQAAVLAALAAPLAADELRLRLAWQAPRLQHVLAELELLGLVERDVRGRIRRAVS